LLKKAERRYREILKNLLGFEWAPQYL
jgi:hypothetical protein